MLRLIARIWAKHSYVFQLEHEASRTEINARLAENLAAERRQNVAKLRAEADEIDKRIKEYAVSEELGFWQCEKGHESQFLKNGEPGVQIPGSSKFCSECGKPVKLVKRSEMSGQEKYESDKERKDAEQVAESKRAPANSRTVAQKIRNL
jgi:hypothetical protein